MDLDADQLKRAAALRALEFVHDGTVLGLGSGSTAEVWLEQLGHQIQAGLKIVGVPTSRKTERLAMRLGVPLASLEDFERVDVTVDGADEIDPRSFNLIKGRGGSLLREKLVATATEQQIIIADGSKLVSRLGERQAVPVEVVRFGWRQTASALERLGCEPKLRSVEDRPVVSDEGHYILDCRFPTIADPERLARQIKALTGVVEHGLFLGLADRLIIADQAGVKVLEPRNAR